MNPQRYEALKESAATCEMSVSHFCDLLAGIAIEKGGEWLQGCMRRRVEEGLRRARERDGR